MRRPAVYLLMILGCITLLWFALGARRVSILYDGCACGRERKWYSMPYSAWHRVALFRTIIKEGDPGHAHRYWDAQYVDLYTIDIP